jgi:hypothetical protein
VLFVVKSVLFLSVANRRWLKAGVLEFGRFAEQ